MINNKPENKLVKIPFSAKKNTFGIVNLLSPIAVILSTLIHRLHFFHLRTAVLFVKQKNIVNKIVHHAFKPGATNLV